MEHGTVFKARCDDNFYRHVGWEQTVSGNACFDEYFSEETIRIISKKISDLLEGVDTYGRRIQVPDSTICDIMSAVYNSHRPQVGDIYSRYIISGMEDKRNDVRDMIDRTIQVIVSDVKNTYDTIKCNNSLSIWNTLYGDGVNKAGLRQTSKIYTRERRPMQMMFNMNY